MDKVKAIKVLKPLANSFVDYANITMKEEDDDTAEALEMAIEALKAQLFQEGTTFDTISRQQAIDALNEYFARIGKLKRRGLTEGEKAISLDTVGIIKTLPPAQPERKHGKWLADNRPGGGFWVCSCCKFPSEAFAADVLYKFCPNCGADMRGGQNG